MANGANIPLFTEQEQQLFGALPEEELTSSPRTKAALNLLDLFQKTRVQEAFRTMREARKGKAKKQKTATEMLEDPEDIANQIILQSLAQTQEEFGGTQERLPSNIFRFEDPFAQLGQQLGNLATFALARGISEKEKKRKGAAKVAPEEVTMGPTGKPLGDVSSSVADLLAQSEALTVSEQKRAFLTGEEAQRIDPEFMRGTERTGTIPGLGIPTSPALTLPERLSRIVLGEQATRSIREQAGRERAAEELRPRVNQTLKNLAAAIDKQPPAEMSEGKKENLMWALEGLRGQAMNEEQDKAIDIMLNSLGFSGLVGITSREE
jgi:hypothetical protein